MSRQPTVERPAEAPLYELIGRAVVRFVWWRYKRTIQAAGALTVVGAVLAVGAYVGFKSSRDDPPQY